MADGPFRARLEERGVRTVVLQEAASMQKVKRESRIPGPGAVSAVLDTARAAARLARDYDLMYANSQKAFVVGCVASVFARKPVLWHLHDILDRDVFSRINIGVDVFLANHVAARVIANSEATANALRANGGARARVGCDLQRARSRRLRRRHGRRGGGATRVARSGERAGARSVRRIAPWKGQHVAIRALELLGSASPCVS